MSIDEPCEALAPLDYRLCTYCGSRLTFRGPAKPLDGPYVAVLGGTETFGKFIADPYAALLEEWVGMTVVNFGIAQAGLSLFSEEPWLLDTSSRAQVTVLQVLGAQNMSNRLYSVHARRNDRFISVSPALRSLYPEVDFTEINFTGHLLETLSAQSSHRFQILVDELKWAWFHRMKRIIGLIQSDVILLWMSDRRPDDAENFPSGTEPHFVDRAMLDAVAEDTAGLVEVVTNRNCAPAAMRQNAEEIEARRLLPGPGEHVRAAEGLAHVISDFKEVAGPPHRRARA